tara:strand:+ start:1156 stop:2607 length:1452 start_codon:yes stop_codon:yes gene_type:complete
MSDQFEIIKKASSFLENKRYTEAKDLLSNFLKNSKNVKIDIKFYYSLYLAFDGLKDIHNAKKYLEKCLKINEKNYIVLNNLANIFLKEGNLAKAEKFYLKSFNLKKDYLLVVVNLAIFYQNIGKLKNSKEFYLKAIELSPERISIYFNLSRIDKNFIDNEKIEYLSKLINKKNEPSEMAYGYFLLAEHEKKKNNFSREIEFLKKANKLSFESMKDVNKKTLNYWNKVIIKKYDSFEFSNLVDNSELKNYKPIFIIGLPRSGSTVTEVLLTSGNKKIISLGESNIFNGIIAKGFSNQNHFIINLKSVEEKILKIFENKNFNKKDMSFIDKSLENFFYIDVILRIFPQAIFVNTTRNIQDNIIAIYKQSLSKLSWTHSIEDILNYTDNYLRIIKYYKKKYPSKILSIELEELSNKTSDISKKIFSFCNLEWSKNVLDFYNRKDLLISTASNIQIRGSIEKYNKKKYDPYRNLLKDYMDKYKWLNR